MYTDLEMYAEVDRRLNDRIREAEEWRLAKKLQAAGSEPRLSLSNLLAPIVARFRQWWSVPPEPQEECC
jgi:hypothetical protein